MTTRAFRNIRQGGFTLIEAVMVIVIVGVLGAVVAVFIRMPVQGYRDSADRAELTDLADLALRRIARDVRLALPNSIVVPADGSSISFFMTKAGGRYLTPDDDLAAYPVLDFANPANLTFTMVGHAPVGKGEIVKGDMVVVNNLGIDPANVYSGQNRATVESFATIDAGLGLYQITLKENPFANQTPSMPSPTSRFHVVTPPVTYYCNGSEIRRQANYGLISGKADVVNFRGDLLANRVKKCAFSYSTDANRGALVLLTLELASPTSGETIKLVHQVHVDNTP